MSDIPFNVQIDRVLDLLCSQIYDSPLSLLRENVQNAYDAILQRSHIDTDFINPEIRITIDNHTLSIYDNGIGMDADGLKTHDWTAGSSGKNNPEARAAGVVGTFGVGAMANFGVCTELNVESKLYGTDITWLSGVKKSELSLSDNCIYILESQHNRSDFGTTIKVTISSDFMLNQDNALAYLKPYVRYLSVPVYLNDVLISQESYDITLSTNCIDSGVQHYKDSLYEFDYRVILNNGVPVLPQCKITAITYNHVGIKGDICLKASDSVLFGLRNSFGLAPIAVNSVFHLNGIVNLLTLVPTAGREAVSRESTSFVSRLISIVDGIVAQEIAKYPIANNSREFHAYIRNTRRYDLAGFIEIPVEKTDVSIRLKDVEKVIDGKNVYYNQRDIAYEFTQKGSGEKAEMVVKQEGREFDYKDVGSTYYQWGRKDPLVAMRNWDAVGADDYRLHETGRSDYGYDTQTGGITLGDAIQHPNIYYTRAKIEGGENWCKDNITVLWNNNDSGGQDESTFSIKTIYDPSPRGFKVPVPRAFARFTKGTNGDGSPYDPNKPGTGPGELNGYQESNEGKDNMYRVYIAGNGSGESIPFTATGQRADATGLEVYTLSRPERSEIGGLWSMHGVYYWTCVPINVTSAYTFVVRKDPDGKNTANSYKFAGRKTMARPVRPIVDR